MEKYWNIRSLIIIWCLIIIYFSIPVSDGDAQARPLPVVVDYSGRRIIIHKPFKRIISLYGAHTVNLFSLGLKEEVVGVCMADKDLPQAKSKQVYTYHDGPERFIAVQPDLVLIRPMIDRAYSNLIHKLEQTGIVVASFQPRTVQEMFSYWRSLGQLVGKEKESEVMILRFKKALSEIMLHLSGIPFRKRKKVFFESIHKKMKTFAPRSITMFCLKSAGGINLARDAITVRNTNIAEYGKERLLAHGDKIDVYLAQYGPMNRITIEMILNEPGFMAIKAVRKGKVYLVDERIVSRPTPDLIKGIRTIAGYLYGERFR